MTFLNTMLLTGFAFLAVPFVIQFLINRKRVVLYWAAFDWMRKAQQVKRRRTRITQILKFLSKLLLLFFLVMLLARPATLSKGGGRKLVVVDNSPSMLTAVDEGTRLDKAKRLASSLIAESDAPVALAVFDEKVTLLSKPRAPGAALDAQVKSIEASPRRGGFADLASSLDALDVFKDVESIYFISDFQKSDFADLRPVSEAVSRLKNKRFVFVPVDSRTGMVNVAVESVSLTPEGFYPGRANELDVKLKNYGGAPAESIGVTLSVDGQKRDRAVMTLAPGAEADVRLRLTLPEGKESRVVVEATADAYLPDNRLLLLFPPPEPISVLAVRPESAPGIPFEQDVFFKSAIKSIVADKFLTYKAISPHLLLSENLSSYDVVALFAVPLPVKDTSTAAIESFLRKGKGLISFADPAAAAPWRALGVDATPAVDAESFPDRLKPDSYLGFMTDRSDLNPRLITFNACRGVKLPENAGVPRLHVKGLEEPIAVKLAVGKGAAVFAGFLPNVGATSLIYNPNFVQVAMRMLRDALGHSPYAAVMAEEIERIPVESEDDKANFTLLTETGESRRMELRRQGDGSFLLSTRPFTDDLFCDVTKDGRRVMSFGFNASRADSAVEPASRADFDPAIKQGLVYGSDLKSIEVRASTERIWITLLLFILALCFENYAHFWRKY